MCGKFISPHLIKYNERISVNNINIKDEEISMILEKIASKVDIYNNTHDIKVKEFEIITTIALIYFAEKKCDFVVLETGLGGRDDCTNIVNGEISIITDIGLDHMDILGKTIEEITNIKAGIIKENNDTIMYNQEIVREIIEETCKIKNNELHLIEERDITNYSFDREFQKIDYKEHKNILISLKGKCQIYNASLCLECIDVLRKKGYKIDEEAVKQGLKTVVHKARFEKINEKPEIIFDGGHNENAIKNVKKMINQYYSNNEKIYIVSILKSKDYKTVVKLLTEDEAILIFTSGNDEKRYVSKEDLFNEAKKYKNNNIYISDLSEAIVQVMNKNSEKITIVLRKFLCVWRCFRNNSREEFQMLEVNNVSYRYKNGDKVLENINLNIKEGEVVSIIGKNGSGKSTLARLIAGITIPNEGNVSILGINTKDKTKFIELRRNVRNSISES